MLLSLAVLRVGSGGQCSPGLWTDSTQEIKPVVEVHPTLLIPALKRLVEGVCVCTTVSAVCIIFCIIHECHFKPWKLFPTCSAFSISIIQWGFHCRVRPHCFPSPRLPIRPDGFALTWGEFNNLQLLHIRRALWVVHWASTFSAPMYTDVCVMMLTYDWLCATCSLFYIRKW